MVDLAELTPNTIQFTDPTTGNTRTFTLDNDLFDIPEQIAVDGLQGRSGIDLFISSVSGQEGGFKDHSGNKVIDYASGNGILNFAKQSACMAYLSGSNQSVAHSTSTKIQLNATVFDIQNEFDTTTNYRFTATVGGIYLVTANVYIDDLADQKYMLLSIVINGTTYHYTQAYASGVSDLRMNNTVLVQLSANDYIEMQVTHIHGSNRDIVAAQTSTFLFVVKVA